jgi:hypothetical protein
MQSFTRSRFGFKVSDGDSPQVDPAWRAEMMAEVVSGNLQRATDALLSLTNHEVDRRWIEDTLLDVIESDLDLQVRQLAVVCLGHVARIHRGIANRVVSRLQALKSDSDLASRARNALEDIEIFASSKVDDVD